MNPDQNASEINLKQADSMVSYDIEAMSIEQLRDNVRAHILVSHADKMRHLSELKKIKDTLDWSNNALTKAIVSIDNAYGQIHAAKGWRRLAYAAVVLSIYLTWKLMGGAA